MGLLLLEEAQALPWWVDGEAKIDRSRHAASGRWRGIVVRVSRGGFLRDVGAD